MSYGMTYDDYWFNSDYTLFWAYKVKNDIEIRRKKNEINYQSWLGGLYIMNAVGSLFDENNKYYEEPINFEKMEREAIRLANMTEEERIAEENDKLEKEMKKQIQKMESIFNKNNKIER